MKDINIREAVFEDLKEINRLVERVFDQFVAPGYTSKGVETFKRYIDLDIIRARFNNKHIIFVAQDPITNHLVGMLEVKNNDHVSLFFVDKDFMGLNIGRKLSVVAFEYCIWSGAKEVTVNSSPNAVEAYEKIGFIKVDEEQQKDGIRYIPMKITLKKSDGDWTNPTD